MKLSRITTLTTVAAAALADVAGPGRHPVERVDARRALLVRRAGRLRRRAPVSGFFPALELLVPRLASAMVTLMRLGWGQEDPAFRQLFTSQFIPGAWLLISFNSAIGTKPGPVRSNWCAPSARIQVETLRMIVYSMPSR